MIRKFLGHSSVGLLLAVGLAWLDPAPVEAQFAGRGGSLGGYGASSGLTGPGMGGGSVIIPYGGRTEGFMPGRMGGGSSLSFRPRPSVSMSGPRPSLILPPLSGEMGRGMGTRLAIPSLLGSKGMSPGAGSFRLGTGGASGSAVMPPSIGYPFRQPPTLLTPGSGAPGTSM